MSFLGSKLAMAFGMIMTFGSLLKIKQEGSFQNFLLGVITMFGVLAYRSVKKRRLGLKRNTALRRIWEMSLLLGMTILVVCPPNFLWRLEDNPVQNFVVPVWVFTAYLIVLWKKFREEVLNTPDQQERPCEE